MLFYILLIATVIYLFYRWYISDYDYFKKRNIDGPTPKFPFGNLPNAFTQKRNFIYDIEDIYQQFRGKSSFVGYFEAGKPKLLIIDPKLVKTILITKFSSFQNNEFSRLINKESDPIFARNPFMLRDEEWKEKRAEVTPAFTASRIRALFPLVEEVFARFSKYINDELNKGTNEPFDAREISAKFTTDAVSSCIFNADAQSFTKEKPEIREAGRKLLDFNDTFAQVQFILLSLFPNINKIWKIRFVAKDLEKFFIDLMKQAIELREKTKITRDDYLAYLIGLKNKKEISELDMAAHGVTFFIDGFETSANAISHAFYELGNNKKVQTKLRDLINKDLIDSDGKIIYEKMLDHPYLDQVFHETLRMHPPLALYNRECSEAITLEDENGKPFRVEKGFSINVPILSIQNDPEHYQHADEFIPERFDPENGGVKEFYNKGVLMPFGDGPRICLGRNFALMQSKAAIVEIVRKFEISVNIKTQRPLVIDEKQFLNIKRGGLWLDFKAI